MNEIRVDAFRLSWVRNPDRVCYITVSDRKIAKCKKTVIASGGNESFPVQFAMLERSNPLTFQEIASAKLVLSLSKEAPRNDKMSQVE